MYSMYVLYIVLYLDLSHSQHGVVVQAVSAITQGSDLNDLHP